MGTVWLLFLILPALTPFGVCSRGKPMRVFSRAALLLLGPHLVLFGGLLGRFKNFGAAVPLFVVACVLATVALLRLAVAPARLPKGTPMRLRGMMGGRALVLWALPMSYLQILLCVFGYIALAPLALPWGLFLADALVTAAVELFFAGWNGVLRLTLTCRRLGAVRRALVLFTCWVPVWNLFLLPYACRLAKEEYDHECDRAALQTLRAESQVCATRYPLLLMHGVGFRDLKYVNYWGRIPRELMRNGAKVYYGNQEAWGTVETNAADICRRIREILDETGAEKVNIIAHSKGGLDARYAVGALGMGPYVASVTTLSTPHGGSHALDTLLKIPDGLYRFIAGTVDRIFRGIGDKSPNFYTACRQFTTAYAKSFNEKVPDAPGVYYQSYMSVMKNCFSDPVLFIPYLVVKRFDPENDGLVSIESAKWGEFQAVFRNKHGRGISHGDIIDLHREDYKGFDILETHVKIVSRLKEKGF